MTSSKTFWALLGVAALTNTTVRLVRAYGRYQALGYCGLRRRLRLVGQMWRTSRVHQDIAHAETVFVYTDGERSWRPKILCAAPHEGPCPAVPAEALEIHALRHEHAEATRQVKEVASRVEGLTELNAALSAQIVDLELECDALRTQLGAERSRVLLERTQQAGANDAAG